MALLNSIINELAPISLQEMDRATLQNRVDTKFVFEAELLPSVLDKIKDTYNVLEVDKRRTTHYKNLYFDTHELKSYYDHHNGKLNRSKIRFRAYLESDSNFLEVKFKNNKGRTIKSRKQIDKIESRLSDESRTFVEKNSSYKSESLSPTLWNTFSRVTFVHKSKNERVTIDTDLKFKTFGRDKEISLGPIVIVEVKREKSYGQSCFEKILKESGIIASGISKYCIGMALTNEKIKTNNFKEKIIKINKLNNVRRTIA